MMKMEINKEGGVTVVAPHGSLDFDNREVFKDELAGLIDCGETAILVDMSAVDLVSSVGLSALLSPAKRMEETGGKFALCCPNKDVLRVLEITGFPKIMNVYPSVDSAIKDMS